MDAYSWAACFLVGGPVIFNMGVALVLVLLGAPTLAWRSRVYFICGALLSIVWWFVFAVLIESGGGFNPAEPGLAIAGATPAIISGLAYWAFELVNAVHWLPEVPRE